MKHIDELAANIESGAAKKPMVIGIIGGAGTGKTYFANYLADQLDACFIEADVVGHHTLLKPEIIQAIKVRFGNDVIKDEGVVDRKALGSKVFGHMEALKDLNTIMHPKMYRMIEEEIKACSHDFVVFEAAVMIEAGFDALVDVMFCIVADDEVRLSRLVNSRHIDRERAGHMMASGRDDFPAYGDYIIDTSLDLDAIKDEIDRIIDRLKSAD